MHADVLQQVQEGVDDVKILSFFFFHSISQAMVSRGVRSRTTEKSIAQVCVLNWCFTEYYWGFGVLYKYLNLKESCFVWSQNNVVCLNFQSAGRHHGEHKRTEVLQSKCFQSEGEEKSSRKWRQDACELISEPIWSAFRIFLTFGWKLVWILERERKRESKVVSCFICCHCKYLSLKREEVQKKQLIVLNKFLFLSFVFLLGNLICCLFTGSCQLQ